MILYFSYIPFRINAQSKSIYLMDLISEVLQCVVLTFSKQLDIDVQICLQWTSFMIA